MSCLACLFVCLLCALGREMCPAALRFEITVQSTPQQGSVLQCGVQCPVQCSVQ
jgi:hypothetical protein